MAAKREWKLRAIEAQNDAMVARREERATRKKVAKHKRRAAGARRHAALMQELNTDLIRSTRQTRMEDRIALREAADALAALAADAAALRDVLEHSASACSTTSRPTPARRPPDSTAPPVRAAAPLSPSQPQDRWS